VRQSFMRDTGRQVCSVERNPPARPGRDIAAVVAAKIVALALLHALFFGPTQRIAVDAASIAARLALVPTTAAAGQVTR
jgi:hypothetical protein